jgi:hypothetical protein
MHQTSIFILALGAVLSSSSAIASVQLRDYDIGIDLEIRSGVATQREIKDGRVNGNPLSLVLQGSEYNYDGGLGWPTTFISSAAGAAGPSGGPLSGGTPYIYSSAHSEGYRDAYSRVYLNYYFSVNGPSSLRIPLIAEFNFSNVIGQFVNGSVTYTNGAGSSDLQYGIVSTSTNQLVISNTIRCGLGYATGCGPGTLISESRNFEIESNTEYLIVLFASSYARHIGGGIGINFTFSEIFIDPYIEINPLFSAKDQYALNFSAGVGNSPLPPSSAVPEMDIWAMMIAGFGMIGVILRRRSKQPRYLRS